MNAKAKEPGESESALESITKGWGKRLLSTGKLAASAARLAARQAIGKEGETDALLGEALAKEMDKMKGMAMKVGQIISYFDGILPEDTHKALRSLQHGGREVAFAQMKAVAESAFGKPLSEIFEALDENPIASASIGQVYRGVYKGRDVAIKIQYPGVWDTIRSDFSAMQRLSRIASLATAVDGPAIVQSMKERFAEECDYQREAQYQDAFRIAFAENDKVLIPQIYRECCQKTVITSEWCEGVDFYDFVEMASQEQKNEVAQHLLEFAYHSIFALGHINADPHPGNYLFPSADDTSVIFLDFGCVVAFPDELVERERKMLEILLDDKKDQFQEVMLATGMVPKPHKFNFDQHWEMMRHMTAPYHQDHFRFTSEYIKQGMEYNGPNNTNMRHLAITPDWVWLQRLQWGLHAVLARLNAAGNFRSIVKQCLETPLIGLPCIDDRKGS